MSAREVDANLAHLYPAFRTLLLRALADVERTTKEPWRVIEGLRSQERHTWLYAQGRTRSGPIVTWKRTPTYHGTGLAADVAPTRSGYKAPRSHWEQLRDCYLRLGLDNPAWGNGDLGHVQLSDAKVRARALAWVRAGFPATIGPAHTPQEVPVYVAGELVPDADAYLDQGRVYAALRPVCEALGWGIEDLEPGKALVVPDDEGEEADWVPLTLKGNRGFVALRVLAGLGMEMIWDGAAKGVRIT